MEAGQAPQIAIVGIKAFGLALRAPDLGVLKLGCDCAHHARRHPVLQIEDIFEVSIEPVRPQMGFAGSFDQLCGDAPTP